MGCQKILRFDVMCVDDRGEDRLFELRERHRKVLEAAISQFGSTVGLRVVIRKEGSAPNSAVDVRVLGREAAIERCISRLVESFGLPPILMAPETYVEERTSGDLDSTLRSALHVMH